MRKTPIFLMGKRELVALLGLSSCCLVMVERLFLAVPWSCLRFVIVVFPDHTHLLFLNWYKNIHLLALLKWHDLMNGITHCLFFESMIIFYPTYKIRSNMFSKNS